MVTRLRIDAPTLRPTRGGLMQAAKVMTGVDSAWMDHGVKFQLDAAGFPEAVPASGTDKQFRPADETFEADPFNVYMGKELSLFQNGIAEEQIKLAWENSKGFGLEKALQERVLEPEAVDLTPVAGTPLTDMKYAVGLLEQYIGERYMGLPTVHANRLGTSLMHEMVVDGSNWALHTTQGTPVANGAGYNAPVTPAGATYVYVTGEVFILEGDVFIDTTNDSVMLKRNRQPAFAEATFLLMAPGPVAKVLVGTK